MPNGWFGRWQSIINAHIRVRDSSNGSKWLYFETKVKEIARKLLSFEHKQKDMNMSINPPL